MSHQIPRFVSISVDDNDPRYPPEIINVYNIDFIQIFDENKIILNFASGKTKILSGNRAIAFTDRLIEKVGEKL